MKGFITVATGKERYYILAYNLLQSYRFHSKDKIPFGIICDRHNEWTEEFDDVVIMGHPAYSYVDKMSIFDLSPYDETIFIDADSLVFRDLNELWEFFRDGPDVGVVGMTIPLYSEKGWWDIRDLGDLQNKVDYKMTCQGGVYFVRKHGKELPGFIETCRFIEQHYFEYHFRMCGSVISDETIISLASCVHHFMPVKYWTDIYAYYPNTKDLVADIISGNIEFDCTEFPGPRYKNSLLIHFGTSNAINRWLYKREVFKLKRGPIGLSNLWEYLLLRSCHAWGKLVMTFYRCFDNKCKYIMDVYS